MAFCINCGHQLPMEANFCPRCGRKRNVEPPRVEESDSAHPPAPDEIRRTLRDVSRRAEAAHIQRVLAAVNGHRADAAEILGISRKNLWEKMREYGLGGDGDYGHE